MTGLPIRPGRASAVIGSLVVAQVVPVVATVCGLGGLATDGVTGFVVTQGNVPEFVHRAMLLLLDRELWARQSTAATSTNSPVADEDQR